jgi:hypothetical protein
MPSQRLDELFPWGRRDPLQGQLRRLMATLEARFSGLQRTSGELDAAIASFNALALSRVNEFITPLAEAAVEALSDVTNLFRTTSTTPLTLATGPVELYIDFDDRSTFVPGAYVSIFANGVSPPAGMIVHVLAFDRMDGKLTGFADMVRGSGSYNDWIVATSPPLPLSQDEIAQMISTAVAGVIGAAPEVLDTLEEIADALGEDPNYAGTITAALAAKANVADLANYPALAAEAQCRFVNFSATQCLLKREGGRYLFINGKHEPIPAGDVPLSNTGLVAGTRYYVYAYMAEPATMALEASATAPIPDVSYGHEIKTGDPTRSLVGQVYMGAGAPGTFIDTPAQRFVRSWHNRDQAPTLARFTAVRSTTSTTFVEINSEIRNEAILWEDESWILAASGSLSHGSVGQNSLAAIGIDSGTPPADMPGGILLTNTAAQNFPFGVTYIASALTEGYHYATLVGRTPAGTASYRGAGAGDQCVLVGHVIRRKS